MVLWLSSCSSAEFVAASCYSSDRMRSLKVEEHRWTNPDGAELAYHVVGEGAPVLLCNGLGGSWKAWTHQIQHFQERYCFISWDYRGLYRSGPPDDLDRMRVEDHAADALGILDQVGVDRAAIFGWSMGVQVGLEVFRRAPERVANLVLMNGVAGRPWETVLDLSIFREAIPGVLKGLGTIPGLVSAVTKRVTRWPETIQWVKRVGLAAPTLDEAVFQELANSFGEIDMAHYVRMLERLGDHDAADMLSTVDVPCLLIAGGRDRFTPRSTMERMCQSIPGAEFMAVPSGTHYLAVEYPEQVNLRVEKFFGERGYGVKNDGEG